MFEAAASPTSLNGLHYELEGHIRNTGDTLRANEARRPFPSLVRLSRRRPGSGRLPEHVFFGRGPPIPKRLMRHEARSGTQRVEGYQRTALCRRLSIPAHSW